MTNLCKLCECGHSNNIITPLPMGTIELGLNLVVIILISFNFTSSFCFAGKTTASELLFQSKAASTVYIFTSSKPSVCALSLGSVISPSSVAASQGISCDIKRSPSSTVKPGCCFNWYNLYYSSLALFSNKWPRRVAALPLNFLYINISTSVALVVLVLIFIMPTSIESISLFNPYITVSLACCLLLYVAKSLDTCTFIL